MVSDKFRTVDTRQPEVPAKAEQLEKGQDVLKAEKKELKFSSHTIKSGETLSEICQQYGIPLKALYAVNQHELDPKIMLKDGKVAYGAPTYHVGDKLNIPSVADVPNAVKYFDQWAKAVISKQRLEGPEPTATGKPAGAQAEKPVSRTQIMDEEHLAAKRAAMMVKVALETQRNQFQTQHEGQGPVDDFVDWFKQSTGLEHSSQKIDAEYDQHRKDVALLEKRAQMADLKQFRDWYTHCTGKEFNPNDFTSHYKKPASLAFPNLADTYEQSQESGRTIVRTTAAIGAASVAVLASGGLAGAVVLGAGAGAGTESVNSGGSLYRMQKGAVDGAIAGASVGLAASVGLIAQTRTVAAFGGGEGALVKIAAGAAGGAFGGATAGGVLEGGMTTKGVIEKKGAVNWEDAPLIGTKTVHGAVVGFATGGAVGAVAPAISEGAAMLKSGSAATTESAAAGAAAGDAAVAESTAAQAFNKTSQLPKETATTSQATPTEAAKTPLKQTGPGGDLESAPITGDKALPKQNPDTQKPGDSGNITPTQSDASKTATPIDSSKNTPAQVDVSKDAPPGGTDSQKWGKGATHDVPPKDQAGREAPIEQTKLPQSQFTKNSEAWQKKVDDLKHDPMVKNVEPMELQNDWQGIKYERTTGGRTVEEMYNPKDGSRISAEVYKDGRGNSYREVTTNANGREITNKFRLTQNAAGEEVWTPTNNAWEKRLFELRTDKKVSNVEEFPMNDDWTGVRYQRNGGTSTVEERVRISDGTKVINEEGVAPGTGNRWKETTMITNGKMTVHQFKRGLNSKGEEDWVRVTPRKAGDAPSANTQERPAQNLPDEGKLALEQRGNSWIENRLLAMRSHPRYSNTREVQIKDGWKAIEFVESQSGAKITQAFNPKNGSLHTVKDYKENGIHFQEDTLELPVNGLTLWRKQQEVKKLSTGFEESDAPQFEWRTVETKRTTLTPDGKTRVDSSTAAEGHKVVTTEQ